MHGMEARDHGDLQREGEVKISSSSKKGKRVISRVD
jgi:hypothetical protein